MLEETSTWAVAVVCFVLLLISIVIEKPIHKIGTWFKKKNKKALYEALEKVKAELMLMGFISLLLTIGQNYISQICISKSIAATMHPCSKEEEAKRHEKKDAGKDEGEDENSGRKLLELVESFIPRRSLATKGDDKCVYKEKSLVYPLMGCISCIYSSSFSRFVMSSTALLLMLWARVR